MSEWGDQWLSPPGYQAPSQESQLVWKWEARRCGRRKAGSKGRGKNLSCGPQRGFSKHSLFRKLWLNGSKVVLDGWSGVQVSMAENNTTSKHFQLWLELGIEPRTKIWRINSESDRVDFFFGNRLSKFFFCQKFAKTIFCQSWFLREPLPFQSCNILFADRYKILDTWYRFNINHCIYLRRFPRLMSNHKSQNVQADLQRTVSC